MVSGRGPSRDGSAGAQKSGEPRRLKDVLAPTLDALAGSEQARAYGAWMRAAGAPVTGGARPRNFSRGTLTVECASSVWANELTYLSADILRKMDDLAPGHPVKKIRFMVAASPPVQESEAPAAKCERSHARPAPQDFDEARARAEGVRDERLRAAIRAVLEASDEGSDQTPRNCTPAG